MKIVMLLSRVPYPLEKGDKLRAWNQIKKLSEKHEIYLICLSDTNIPDKAENEIKKYCKEVRFFKLNKIGIVWRLFLALFSSQPFQVKYFHSYFIQKKITSYIQSVRPDHIFAQLIRVSEYVKNIHHIPKTLDYMDALSKGIERRIAKTKWWNRYLFKSEAKRLLAYENLIYDYFENKIIISEQDRKLIYHPEQKNIQVIPNGVDTQFFQPNLKLEKKYTFLFNGNMSYAPNVDCVKFIIEEIIPHLKNQSFRFLISGANPSSDILQLAKNDSRIEVSGWIDDIRDAYHSSYIFLAPMQIGTGLQNKLLEAMAMGIPCITTSLANNAIQAQHEKEIIVADSRDEIVFQIEKLLTDKSYYTAIQQNALVFVKEKFDWNKVCEPLNRMFINSKQNP